MKKNKMFFVILIVFTLVLTSCTTLQNDSHKVEQNPIRAFVNKSIKSLDDSNDAQKKNETETVKLCNKTLLKNVTKIVERHINGSSCNISYYNLSISADYGKWFKKQELLTNDFKWYYLRKFNVFNPYDKIVVVEMCLKFYKHIWQDYSKEIESPLCFTRDIYPKTSCGISYEWYVDRDDDLFYNLTLLRVLDFNQSYEYLEEKNNRANADNVNLKLNPELVKKLGGCFMVVNKTVYENITVIQEVNITVPCSELNQTN